MVFDTTGRPKSSGIVLPVQYLRGIAALMVVWHHAQGQVRGVEEFISFSFGYEGVDLFFVISGFIMVVTTAGTAITPGQFLQRRFVRVVPLYWILTLAMVGVWFVQPGLFKSIEVRPDTLLKSLLFIPHYSASFPDEVWPLLVPGWTLNFEMYFYLVFGLLLFLPERVRLPVMLVYFGSSVAIGLLFGPFHAAIPHTYTRYLLIEFAAGAVIGRIWLAGQLRLRVGISVMCLAAGAALVLVSDGKISTLLGALLLVTGALNPNFMSTRRPLWLMLGDSSYSLYLTHLFTLGLLRVIWTRLHPGEVTLISAASFMAVALVACSMVGYLSYILLEKPLLRLFRSRSAVRAVTA